MVKEKNRPERIFPKLKYDLIAKGDERVRKRLMTAREVKLPKMTELLTKTEGYKMALLELGIKPERKRDD